MVTKVQRRFAARKRRKFASARKARANISIGGESWKKATNDERKKLLKILKQDIIEAKKDRHAAKKARKQAEDERKKAFKERRDEAKKRRQAAAKRRKAAVLRKER